MTPRALGTWGLSSRLQGWLLLPDQPLAGERVRRGEELQQLVRRLAGVAHGVERCHGGVDDLDHVFDLTVVREGEGRLVGVQPLQHQVVVGRHDERAVLQREAELLVEPANQLDVAHEVTAHQLGAEGSDLDQLVGVRAAERFAHDYVPQFVIGVGLL